MKANTCLVIDVWEGQLEIDEAVLKSNGVAGMGIRLNDINGGHHLDNNFAIQWKQALNFARFPYFVYNPWVSGLANWDFLKAVLLDGCKIIALDLEVRKPGYSPATYAGEVVKFLEMCQAIGIKAMIYTGAGFTDIMTKWPKMDYWWAQYPDNSIYFGGVKTWDELKVRLDKLDKPFNAGSIPGTLRMWQFSGDKLILPGTIRPIDISIFYGNETELSMYVNAGVSITPAPVVGQYYVVKDDLWAGNPNPPRNGLPSTRRYRGGKGTVQISPSWLQAVFELNQAHPEYQFSSYPTDKDPTAPLILKKRVGWCNMGDNVVEQVTFAGNIVHSIKTDGDTVYIDVLYNDQTPPAHPPLPTELLPDPRIQLLSTQFLTYLEMNTNGKLPRTVLLANPGEQCYMSAADLAPVQLYGKKVKITAMPSLRVRAWPSTQALTRRNILWGVQEYVVFTTQIGADIWGRVAGGWIALKYGGAYCTDWRG